MTKDLELVEFKRFITIVGLQAKMSRYDGACFYALRNVQDFEQRVDETHKAIAANDEHLRTAPLTEHAKLLVKRTELSTALKGYSAGLAYERTRLRCVHLEYLAQIRVSAFWVMQGGQMANAVIPLDKDKAEQRLRLATEILHLCIARAASTYGADVKLDSPRTWPADVQRERARKGKKF